VIEMTSVNTDDEVPSDEDVLELDSVPVKRRPCQVAFLDEEGRKKLLELREKDVPPPKDMAGCAQIIAQSVFVVLKTSGDDFRQWGLEKLKGEDEVGAAENFLEKMSTLVKEKEEADLVAAVIAAADAQESANPVRKRRRRMRRRRDSDDSDNNPLDLTVCSQDLVPEIRLLLDQESQ